MSVSPAQLSLKKLRDDEWMCQVVEHWNPFARIRQDLFGIIDILAVKGKKTLAVQVTTWPEVGRRIKKIKGSKTFLPLILAGWEIEVHGWKKIENRWKCKITKL